MSNNKSKHIVFGVLILGILLILTGIIFLNTNKSKKTETVSEQYLQSLDIVGFSLDKEFDKNVFDYNVEVDTDEVQIKCDSNTDIDGCNVTIDLKDKKDYNHQIIVEDNKGKKHTYTIHIIKNLKETNSKLRITAIDGIPLEWTNEDVKIAVHAEYDKDKGIWYSFDNGKTWATDNFITISQNRTLNIMIRNNNSETSATKIVTIDKIDTTVPSASIKIKEKNKGRLVLEALGIDEESGIDSYSWNKGQYVISNLKEITKAGTYTLTVKDKAGNISKEASIVIKDSDFTQSQEVSRTFTLTYMSNGAVVSKNSDSCTTTKSSCSIKLPTITKNGATIIGFSPNKDSKTAKYKAGDTINISDSEVLYAITKKSIKATFVSNGATSISSTSLSCDTYNSDTKCSIKTPTIKREGGEVVGWSTYSTSSSASYKQDTNLEIENNMTLYAITYKKYTATFDKNGANSVEFTTNSCKAYNTYKTCPVLTPNFSRENSTLIGWNTNKNATVEEVGWRTYVNLDSNKTYYAISSITLTANFYLNGADSIDATKASCVIYNANTNGCVITTPAITKKGGSVVGWNTNKNATSALYKAKSNVTLKSNTNLYAITYESHNVMFIGNGATVVGEDVNACEVYNSNTSCTVKPPELTRSGWKVYGWADSPSATSAQYSLGTDIPLTETIVYIYGVTSKELVATFDVTGLNSYEAATRRCVVYNNNSSCKITLPRYNKKGQFNRFWSTEKVGQLEIGVAHPSKYFNQVGTDYELTNNTTFYPNANNSYYKSTSNYFKYRNLNIKKTYTIGNTLFEYESGISDTTINDHITFLKEAYSKIPWIFIHCKVFVMTSDTYANYSIAYGLTIPGPKGSYSNIDITDDKGTISPNATLHELAHAWDSRYGYIYGIKLRDTYEFTNFYNTRANNGTTTITKTEFFAATITNYYWHYICYSAGSCKVNKDSWYGYENVPSNVNSEANAISNVLLKYTNINV